MNTNQTPQSRKAIPLQYVCKLNPQVDLSEFQDGDELTFLPMNRVKSGYFIPNSENFSKHALSYNTFAEGDIVLAKVTPCFENGNIAIAENLVNGKGFGSSELFVVRTTNADRKFLFYVLQSSTFKQEGEASMTGAGGLKRVSPDVIRKHRIYFPSSNVQRLIANYLDLEIVRIDALVAEKEHMLALLEEKRAALISRAVTCGLNPNAPLKPSGLDWLGDIPMHWGVDRLKYHLRTIEQGWSPQCDNSPAEPEEWGVLKVGSVNSWVFDPTENKRLPEKIDPLTEYEIKYGDVLMSRANTTQLLGSVACVPEIKARLLLCDKLYRLQVVVESVDREFLVAVLRSKSGRFQLEREASGTSGSMQNIGQDTVQNCRIAVPPIKEQKKIVKFISEFRNESKQLEVSMEKSISLLKERRAALITAAITGQIPIEEMTA